MPGSTGNIVLGPGTRPGVGLVEAYNIQCPDRQGQGTRSGASKVRPGAQAAAKLTPAGESVPPFA